MSRYDTTFIVNPQIGDDAINASVTAITEIITSNKGEVLRERRIGSRRLAYAIDRQTHGYYVTLIHDCDANVLPILEKHFKLGESYLRELTIRYDGDPFRKSITDVMMGGESEERRPSGDRDDSDDRRPRSRGAAPRGAAPRADAPKADAPKADTPKVEAPKADAEVKAEAPAAEEAKTAEPVKAEAPTATTDEETL